MNTDLILALTTLVDAARQPQPIDPGEDPPPAGSIVLLHGPEGTAYQRHHGDGLYHSTGTGSPLEHHELFQVDSTRQPLLVYRAPER